MVLLTAISAVCTAAWALYTEAWAEARLLGDGVDVVVVVAVELVFPAEPPLLEGDFVLGTITVTVTLGVVFVIFVPPLVGVSVSPVPLVGFFPVPAPGLNDANSTSDAVLVKLVSLAVPDPVDADPLDPAPPPEPLEPQFAVVWSSRQVS